MFLALIAVGGCQAPGAKSRQFSNAANDNLIRSPVVDWAAAKMCADQLVPNEVFALEFRSSDPRIAIPELGQVRSRCLRLPVGSASVDFWTTATFEAFLTTQTWSVFPSFMLLDDSYRPIADFRFPPVYWDVRMSSAGLGGNVQLGGQGGKMPVYIVVYLASEVLGTKTSVSRDSVSVANVGGTIVGTGSNSLTLVVTAVPEGALALRVRGN